MSLSEQQVIDCDTEEGGCEGGDMGRAFHFFEGKPLYSEKSYPYQGKVGACRRGLDTKLRIKSHDNISPGEENLRRTVGELVILSLLSFQLVHYPCFKCVVLTDFLILSFFVFLGSSVTIAYLFIF